MGCAAQSAPQEAASPSVPAASDNPAPTATATPENREGRGSDTYIFLGPDGETEQTLEQLSESINIPVSENKDTIEAQTTYYKKMEEMVNYFPTEKEVRNNLNIPEGQQLEVEDYLAAVKLHNKGYDGLYETPSGTLYDFMQELSVQVAASKIETINSGETLYEATIDFARTKPEFVVRDNAKDNSIDDVNPMAGTYELTFTGFGPNKTNSENPVWLVDGNVVVTKKAE